MTTTGRSGFSIKWDAEHRDKDGNLISRQMTIDSPKAPECLNIKCLARYIKDAIFYALLSNYHARRVFYAEKNRHKKILERYRTGEPSPKNIWQALHANIKLTCPICRKFDLDPLLFGGKLNGSESDGHK